MLYHITSLSVRFLLEAFTIDLYLSQAASALAAQVATRAIAACAFPLFSRQVSQISLFHTEQVI